MKNIDTMTRYPLHILLFDMQLYSGAFTFCICDVSAVPSVRPDHTTVMTVRKTALMYDPVFFFSFFSPRQVSATAHSIADDTASPTTQADKEENTTG